MITGGEKMINVGQLLDLQFNVSLSAKSRGFFWYLEYDSTFFQPIDIDAINEGYQFEIIPLYTNSNVMAPVVKLIVPGKIGCTISTDFAGSPLDARSYELFRFKGLKAVKGGNTQVRYTKFTVLDEAGAEGNVSSIENGGPSLTIGEIGISTLEIIIRN